MEYDMAYMSDEETVDMSDEDVVDMSDGSSNNTPETAISTEQFPLETGCDDNWTWDKSDKSHEVRLYGPKHRTALFHPNWSNGAAGVRGTRVLNCGRYYWEINVSQRIFGTSMMFGIATKKARLHTDNFINMLGEDENGWGLSHKGILWHNNEVRFYTRPFKENEATTVGILFDGIKGTLTFYKDGVCLGIAFSGLNNVKDELYPVVCSTAAKTVMSLGVMKREFGNLQDRCRASILSLLENENDLNELQLPNRLKMYIAEEMDYQRPKKTHCADLLSHPFVTHNGTVDKTTDMFPLCSRSMNRVLNNAK